MGWCRLKLAGVEHCGLCGLAHLGHSRTCPHLNSEAQVVTLLQTLKESTEDREKVELATKYLRSIRGDLVARKRNAEKRRQEAELKRRQEEEAKAAGRLAASNIVTGNVNVNGFGRPVNGYTNGVQQQGGYHEVSMGGT